MRMLLYTRLAPPKPPKRRSRGGKNNAFITCPSHQTANKICLGYRLYILVSSHIACLTQLLLGLICFSDSNAAKKRFVWLPYSLWADCVSNSLDRRKSATRNGRPARVAQSKVLSVCTGL